MNTFRRYEIEIAHSVSNLPAADPRTRLHGHTLIVEVYARLDPNLQAHTMTHPEIDAALAATSDQVNYRNLNDIPGLESGSLDGLAIWFWRRLSRLLPTLIEVRVFGGCTGNFVLRGIELQTEPSPRIRSSTPAELGWFVDSALKEDRSAIA